MRIALVFFGGMASGAGALLWYARAWALSRLDEAFQDGRLFERESSGIVDMSQQVDARGLIQLEPPR